MSEHCKEQFCMNAAYRTGGGYCYEHQHERAAALEAERDALAAQLATVTAEVKRLQSYLEAMHSDDAHDMSLSRIEEKLAAFKRLGGEVIP